MPEKEENPRCIYRKNPGMSRECELVVMWGYTLMPAI